ncbi:hypothetical protein ACNSOP_09110 [Aliarcobacter lanthieri]|uniref:hypothetical protein n=1 Tax=Aliarcobacter lanthieri TaxID=1355374 RepID=UPI003AA97D04
MTIISYSESHGRLWEIREERKIIYPKWFEFWKCKKIISQTSVRMLKRTSPIAKILYEC